MTGGLGADSFEFVLKADLVGFGNDVIADFNASEGDVIQLNDDLEAMVANGQYSAILVGNDVFIDFDGDVGTITLLGVGQFQVSWFV
jgi:hypothetical protein